MAVNGRVRYDDDDDDFLPYNRKDFVPAYKYFIIQQSIFECIILMLLKGRKKPLHT